MTEAWDANPQLAEPLMLGHIVQWFYAGLANPARSLVAGRAEDCDSA